jgi:hypothetical protein
MKLRYVLFMGFLIGAVVSVTLLSTPFSLPTLLVRMLGSIVISVALIVQFRDGKHEFTFGNTIEHTVVVALAVTALISSALVLKDSYKNGLNSKLLEQSKATGTVPPQKFNVSNTSATGTGESLLTIARVTATPYQVVRTSHEALRAGQASVGPMSRTSAIPASSPSIPLFSIRFETCDDEARASAQLFVTVMGVGPLRNLDIVFYAVSDVEPVHFLYGGREMYHAHFQTVSGVFRAGVFVPKQDRITITAKSSAVNGAWTQILKARRIDGRWEWRSAIFNDNPRTISPGLHPLRDSSSAGFPFDERSRPILPVLLKDIGDVTARTCEASNGRLPFRRTMAEKSESAPRRMCGSQCLFESLLDIIITPVEHQLEAGHLLVRELNPTGPRSYLWCVDPRSFLRREGFVVFQQGGWFARSCLPAFRPPLPGYARVPTFSKSLRPLHE